MANYTNSHQFGEDVYQMVNDSELADALETALDEALIINRDAYGQISEERGKRVFSIILPD